MNLRKLNGPLKPKQCRPLEHAWHQAAKDGHPLNALISIRPTKDLTPIEYRELVNKTWNRLGVWSRRNTAKQTFHCILTLETQPQNNFHALMHIESNAKLTLLTNAVSRWFSEQGDAHVIRANQNVSYTPSGKIRSALGYITKELERGRLHGPSGNIARAVVTSWASDTRSRRTYVRPIDLRLPLRTGA